MGQVSGIEMSINNLFLPPAMIASLGLMSAARVMAQNFATLYSFPTVLGPDYSDN
jgi:hypothetical protein